MLKSQSGELLLSPRKQRQVERIFAYRQGKLATGFANATFNKDKIETADETLFAVTCDNVRKLKLIRDNHVKHANVMSSSEPAIIIVQISGG